jgi:muramoyltetrapeptide carboxypeptidase
LIPRRLPARAVIGVCAPSGRVDPAQLDRGVAVLRGLGHEVIVSPQATVGWRYFAGEDAERVAGLDALLADDRIDMVIAARGGYGLSRLLGLIDWKRVGASGKIFAGFSDFTAFNCAAHALGGGLITFQAPMVASDFGSVSPDAFMQEHFWAAVTRDSHAIEDIACEHSYGAQRIEGPLWGGNLALLVHLMGTPYFPRIDDGILFVEEIAEDPYALERQFLQLYHSGVLARCRAVLIGDLTDCKPNNPNRYPYSIAEMLESVRGWVSCPVLTGLPFGHIARKATLPFGAPATLTIRSSSYDLRFSGQVG